MSRMTGRARALGGAGLIAALAFAAAPIAADSATALPGTQAAECVPVASAEQLRCSVTYRTVGGAQEFVVPAGITSVEVELIGGNGGHVNAPSPGYPGALGGSGARVTGTLRDLTPGERLLVTVAGNGSSSRTDSGGSNGGGAAGETTRNTGRASGGGGATDIRSAAGDLASRLAVAGGGGGAVVGGPDLNHKVGIAGGDASSAGSVPQAGCAAAQPGTASAGGIGGSCGNGDPGSAGTAGTGGAGGVFAQAGVPIGGGGGYFGGGGGVGGYYWTEETSAGSGAGGSSLVPAGGTEESSLHAEPSATVSYLVDIETITVPPVSTEALRATGFSASTTGPGGEQIDMSHLITEVTSGSDRLTCADSLCTASESGEFPVTLAFGTSGRTSASLFTASKLPQSISFGGGEFTAGSAFDLTGVSTSGLGLSYAVRSGACSIEGMKLTAQEVGTCVIAANQPGNATYLSASEVIADFRVSAQPQPAPNDSKAPGGSPSPSSSEKTHQELAHTGADSLPMIAALGAISVIAGAVVILAYRQRRGGEFRS